MFLFLCYRAGHLTGHFKQGSSSWLTPPCFPREGTECLRKCTFRNPIWLMANLLLMCWRQAGRKGGVHGGKLTAQAAPHGVSKSYQGPCKRTGGPGCSSLPRAPALSQPPEPHTVCRSETQQPFLLAKTPQKVKGSTGSATHKTSLFSHPASSLHVAGCRLLRLTGPPRPLCTPRQLDVGFVN